MILSWPLLQDEFRGWVLCFLPCRFPEKDRCASYIQFYPLSNWSNSCIKICSWNQLNKLPRYFNRSRGTPSFSSWFPLDPKHLFLLFEPECEANEWNYYICKINKKNELNLWLYLPNREEYFFPPFWLGEGEGEQILHIWCKVQKHEARKLMVNSTKRQWPNLNLSYK